jgi:uncharacterized protein YkwD
MEEFDPTVTVALYECHECDATIAPSYHVDSCGAPVVYVSGNWQCSACGVSVSSSNTCFECGGDSHQRKLSVGLDLGPSVRPEAVEQAVHRETNRERRNHGIGTLDYSDHLSAIALQHSRDMATRDYFSHESPDGDSAQERYRDHDHDDRSVGENIAYRQPGPTAVADEIATSVISGWMDSSGHRENLLRERFEKEGIGVYIDPDGTVYTTQNFY